MCYVALFAALTAVCAQITVPLAAIPFTLQTLMVTLAGLLLGPKRGAAAMTVYMLLGLAGAPVFAAFGGGLSSVAKPSFGFVLGFIPAAFVIGLIAQNGLTWLKLGAASLAGAAVTYAVGLPYMYVIIHVVNGAEATLGNVLMWGMLPFLPGDALKIIVAIPLCLVLRRRLNYANI